ncbi:ECF RNA polymerase sigma factor SigJ [Streptomyces sp. RB5]|uniref:ECF RNA polymerase sigma factor SigJ n=1 Tax=Streptomyces smaragdinus TaxID=2585196 RepID=A0A7K0CKF9_9ACTN|nr:sigma-70 family RNA polymerase sigma factor [Streptomyces smaragdinus]MQY13990.1 ECF RNA polymerase sigma factor SigJ [Streptomyces smaragdinus]
MNDDDLDAFVDARPRLFRTAHRIVGDPHEAEDILQEVWLRWYRTDRAAVTNAEAFLLTTTSRLAINHIRSARHRRETPALPREYEDTVYETADPQAGIERGETIELAVQLLCERLLPSERAVFVLREGFRYPYQLIAERLRITPGNARQLATRARARIMAGRTGPYSTDARDRLLKALEPAARGGGLSGLETTLAADTRFRGRPGPLADAA